MLSPPLYPLRSPSSPPPICRPGPARALGLDLGQAGRCGPGDTYLPRSQHSSFRIAWVRLGVSPHPRSFRTDHSLGRELTKVASHAGSSALSPRVRAGPGAEREDRSCSCGRGGAGFPAAPRLLHAARRRLSSRIVPGDSRRPDAPRPVGGGDARSGRGRSRCWGGSAARSSGAGEGARLGGPGAQKGPWPRRTEEGARAAGRLESKDAGVTVERVAEDGKARRRRAANAGIRSL